MKKVGLIVAFLSLIVLFYLGFLRYIRIDEIKMSGYGLSSTQISQNLQANELEESHQNLSLLPVNEYETVYQRGNEYYIGEKKKESINVNYPIISEDGSRVLNQSSEAKGITSDYEKVNLYKNAVIANGEIYHVDDGVKAEEEKYIFLEIEPNIYMSLQDITIKTNTSEYVIKKNSYLYFAENFIRYYNYNEKNYQYFFYDDLDANSEITLMDTKIPYEAFLEKMGIKEKEEENTVEETPNEEIEETPENPQKPNETPTYVKPEVSATNMQINTYSIMLDLIIQDKTERIKKSPTFELYINDRLYKRNSFSTNGTQEITKLLPNTTYKILGYYTYYNETGEQVRNTFYETEFTTKGIEGIEKINLSYDKVEPKSTYANIKGLYITNEKESEVLKGIDHFAIEIEGEEHPFSSSINSSLSKLEKVEYTTPYILKSNTEYNLKIKAYDVGGNELEVNYKEIEIKTSKQTPTVNVEITNTDITEFTANLQIENPDKVLLQNLTYTVIDTNNQIVKEGEAAERFTVGNLNENTIYTLHIYGDYDLEDGEGNHVKEKLKEVKVSTVPVASLGYLQVSITNDEIKQEEASFDFKVNSLSTDQRYMALLHEITIHVYEKETGKEVDTIEYTEEKIENLRKGGTEKLHIKNLTSKTEYEIEIESNIKQGDKEYQTDAISNVGEFQTKKKEASISILNKFTTSNMIDFDVKVRDEDGAINSNRVILEVRNANGSLLSYQEIGVNEEYKRIILNNLEVNQKYTFTYIAEDYNVGYTNDTNEENKVIYEEEIITEEGISGSINLKSLLKQLHGKNKFDIEDEQRWTNTLGTSTSNLQEYNYEENSTSFTVTSGTKTYAYYLPEYAGKEITISFKAKKENSTNNLPAYVVNGNSLTKQYEIENLTNEYQEYTYTFPLNNTGYIGFYLEEETGGTTKITFKDIQIEEGNTKTEYEAFQKGKKKSIIHIKIEDKRNEITNQRYYIQKYKNNEFIKELEYSLEEGYEKTLEEEVEDNATYTFILQVKIRERYYTLDELEFDTTEEIRSISTIDEFLAMHPNGNYVVTEDLDFRNDSRSYNTFSGTLDFQGHKVYLDAKKHVFLINTLESSAILKNILLHHYYDSTEISYAYSFVNENNGLIQNIQVVLEEYNALSSYSVSLISLNNLGIIEKFSVNLKSSITGTYWLGSVSTNNQGIIRNGYIYGESIRSIYPTNATIKNVGAVAGSNNHSGKIENVYSLIDVNTIESGNAVDKQVGNLTGRNDGTIQNSYVVGSGENRDLSLDINIGSTLGSTSNLYYVSEDLYAGEASTKVSPMALWNVDFQNEVLNQDQAFIVEEYVSQGYYPQIDWPDYMPAQELIPLPEVKDDDLVDVLSVEKVTQEENKATATILVSNPSLEKITGIKIQYVATKILNQETSNGTTRLTIEISNPVFYIEDYLVESISAIGVSNISYTREYESGERTVKLDLYRPVYTINDWKDIKNSSSESYKLMNDLDFLNQSAETIRLGDFRGKLNGNNYTIRNIEIINGNPMINILYGTIENLYIENYKHNTTGGYAGIITLTSQNSRINNVHVRNIQLGSAQYIGGLVGYGNGGNITNSSVTNFSVYDNIQNTSNLSIGGLIGFSNVGTNIQNSYVQNLSIETPDFYSIQTIGGIVGYLYSGTVQNVYATGNITTSASNVGGIVGLNNSSIQNVYSLVNIYSKGSYIGGIAGNVVEGSSTASISNSLAIGNVYTSSDTTNIGRIVGNPGAVYSNSYAWKNQHVNGEISSSNSNILLSTEELKDSFTYTNRIFLGDSFDYNNISTGELPKLYNTNKNELLPNQEDTYLPIREFEKKEIVVDNRITEGTILLTLDNPNNYEVTGITIEDLEIVSISRNTTNNGETILQIEVKPEKAFDSYRLTEIKYQVNDEERVSIQDIKIPLQFYKDLETYEDWQEISKEVAENYRLVGDIDFENRENSNYNVLFNRLEGTDEGHSLKNIKLEVNNSSQGLIYSINNSMKDIRFENVVITQTSKGNTNYNGIIVHATGNMENLQFTNITIATSNTNLVGIVANGSAVRIQNVNMNQVNVFGNVYVGGLIANINSSTLVNIEAMDVNVQGDSYVGGIIGKDETFTSHIFSIYKVTGKVKVVATGNNIGGIIGFGNAREANLSDSYVQGVSNVGGISGYCFFGAYYSVVSNSEITGSGSMIGGIAGGNYGIEHCLVQNSEISSTNISSTYIGGLGGYVQDVKDSSVIDTRVISSGNYVGGLVGYINNNVSQNSVTGVIVEGNQYVGGMFGGIWEVLHCNLLTVNATVIANLSDAGAIIGYFKNLNMASTQVFIRQVIVENCIISAPIRAGGIIGIVDEETITNSLNNIIISANVETTAEGSSPGMLIGNGDNYATNMTGLGIYNESKLISPSGTNNVVDLTIPGIEPSDYVTASQLALQSTYTSRGFSTSYFDYSELQNGYYPFLKNIDREYITLIPLPVSSQNMISLMSLMSIGYMNNLYEYHELPEYEVYVSGVDTINIEFSKIDPETMFTIAGQSFFIEQRVYSFTYNFDEEIKVTLTDGWNSKEKVYSSEELKQTLLTYKEYYYFLKDGKVISNDREVNGLEGINLFNQYILLKDKRIYDIETREIKEENYENFKMIDSVPLYSFTYDNHTIDTYYEYSVIDKERVIKQQILKKNSQIEMISSSLSGKKTEIIMDSYNNKEYLTLLIEGKIVDLKEKIEKPVGFKNKEIVEISNNIYHHSNLVIVRYENGKVIVFNYRTGNIIYTTENESQIDVISYFMENFSITNDHVFKNRENASYEESKEMKKILEEKDLTEISTGESYSGIQREYITSYDPVKEKYVIYDVSSLVENKEYGTNIVQINNEQSINDIISMNNTLNLFYTNQIKVKTTTKKVRSIIIFLCIFLIIGILIFLSGKLLLKSKKDSRT